MYRDFELESMRHTFWARINCCSLPVSWINNSKELRNVGSIFSRNLSAPDIYGTKRNKKKMMSELLQAQFRLFNIIIRIYYYHSQAFKEIAYSYIHPSFLRPKL